MLGRGGGLCPQGEPGGRRSGARRGQPLDHLRGGRIAGGGAHLLLPQIEEAPGQGIDFRGVGHRDNSSFGPARLAACGHRVHDVAMTTSEKPADVPGTANPAAEGKVVKVKKYANRRLYNTATSSYVTLDDLSRMVKEGIEFVVHDAKSGDDITRSVLTQIIVEEESKGGQNMLPIGFLRQLIGFYGDNLQSLVPRYLEASMQMFTRNQEQFRDSMKAAFGGFFPFGGQLEELNKQNMAMFQNAMSQIWAPFGQQPPGDPKVPGKEPQGDGEAALTELKRQMELMQRRLEELSRK